MGLGMRDKGEEVKVEESRFGASGWGLVFLCLVFGVWGLGFGIWGLGFGVWGLGFGF